MSVLIKGMIMPSCCLECEGCDSATPWGNDYFCMFDKQVRDVDNIDKGRMEWCPLVEVSDELELKK